MSEVTLVIGASGRVGKEVVKLLLEKGEKVRAAARAPLSRRFSALVEAVEFDFDQPLSFAPALKGVHKVFLIARPGDNQSHRAAMPLIDEAKKQDIRLIVNLTAMGVEQDETFMLRLLEKYLVCPTSDARRALDAALLKHALQAAIAGHQAHQAAEEAPAETAQEHLLQ